MVRPQPGPGHQAKEAQQPALLGKDHVVPDLHLEQRHPLPRHQQNRNIRLPEAIFKIHEDLQPVNVFINNYGHVLLGDQALMTDPGEIFQQARQGMGSSFFSPEVSSALT